MIINYIEKLKIIFPLYFSNFIFNPCVKIMKGHQNRLFFYNLNKKIWEILLIFRKFLKRGEILNIMLIGRDRVNWRIDKRRKIVNYFLKKNKVKLTKNFLIATHVFCVSYDLLFKPDYNWVGLLKKIFKFKVIGVVTNSNLSKLDDYRVRSMRKYNEKNVNYLMNLIDIWIVPSIKMHQFLKDQGCNVFLMPFYASCEAFYYLKKSKKELCNELNLDYKIIQNKIIIGSFQRDSLGSSLNKPKWQKNPDGLIKILIKLHKDKFILLLSGPRRHYIINECEKYNIPYIYYGDIRYIREKKDDMLYNNHSERVINLLYNLADLYIITSLLEGTPQSIIEASLTKTLIFSTDVGIAKDFLHEDLIYSEKTIEKVINFLFNFRKFEEKRNKYINYNYNNVQNVMNEENYTKLYKNLIIEKLF